MALMEHKIISTEDYRKFKALAANQTNVEGWTILSLSYHGQEG